MTVGSASGGRPGRTVLINGTRREIESDVAPDMPLLWLLRDRLQLTGTKYGCGAALCGACTVHIDGQARRSCQVQVSRLRSSQRITTIEGLAGPVGEALQAAWVGLNVPQCGYCQSGQIMQAAALLASTPQPSDRDIDEAMSANICRCATYVRIRAAIRTAAASLSARA